MSRDPDTDPARHTPDATDTVTVTWQLGREPRGAWHVVVRCSYGYAQVIETAPVLDGGEPFPTLYYLTCPWLAGFAGDLESSGEIALAARELAGDRALARRMVAADSEYRARRARAAGGEDPTPGVGIAGQRDALATKCLHAHVATALAGIDDPVGLRVLGRIERDCPDKRCARPPAEAAS